MESNKELLRVTKDRCAHTIIKAQVPLLYKLTCIIKFIDKVLCRLWIKYRPDYMVHCVFFKWFMLLSVNEI